MTKIRLYRIGRKKSPHYRIIVTDIKNKANGAYIENIGTYSPKDGSSSVNKNVALLWLSKGAQPTTVVKNIFSKHNINQLFAEYKLSLKAEVKAQNSKNIKAST
ncbi:30S ribosomal protein S16 [Mycoplasma sp. SG1]|uniref:30S ribosomal protein S16 n=1 Tax=Mycoplasma sp. SG1 TaxID=2810348 RepID=UPI002023BF3D|nr:30S ribosomal protein S16 [Mycoplasma sp. SG1]URM53042.1 30S ribosomal protein S16 [Mycoplasma sp. SG1]